MERGRTCQRAWGHGVRVDIGGGRRLFFDMAGQEFEPDGAALRRRPTLIALHGSPGMSDHSALSPALSPLADAMRVIYLDIAGAGRSDDPPPGTPFSLDLWSDDLVRFCEALEIEKPVVLGLSGGGFVAQAHAIRHPDHAAGFIFASTQARLDPERSIAMFGRLGGAEAAKAARDYLCAPPDRATLAAFSRVCLPLYNRAPRSTEAGGRIVMRRRLSDDFHRYPDGIWHVMNLLDDLHSIRRPVLVLAGDEDPITPVEDSLDIAARIDPALVTLVRLAGCGHGVWRDQPDRAFEIIRDFVARIAP